MKGLRIHRLLASTAAILLVAGMASIASAEPKFGTMNENAAAPAMKALRVRLIVLLLLFLS